MKEIDVHAALTNSFDFWLSQHEITVQNLMEKAIAESMTRWLELHGDDVATKLRGPGFDQPA